MSKFGVLNGARYFSSGIFQNHLVFIQAKNTLNNFSGTTWINSGKSNGISEENTENITYSDSNFAPTFVDHHVLPDINFNGRCLTNNIHIPKEVIYIYIYKWP